METLNLVAVAIEAAKGNKPLIHAQSDVDTTYLKYIETENGNIKKPQTYNEDVLPDMKAC